MRNRELYEAALRLLGENTAADENEDYAERAPYLLATCVSEAAEIDRHLRLSRKEAPKPLVETVSLPLDEEFPLSDELSHAAVYYLAAMLILESDERRSDILYDRYCDSLLRIEEALPASLEPIADRYGAI